MTGVDEDMGGEGEVVDGVTTLAVGLSGGESPQYIVTDVTYFTTHTHTHTPIITH